MIKILLCREGKNKKLSNWKSKLEIKEKDNKKIKNKDKIISPFLKILIQLYHN
jgi:hypothetical protein